ncbi:hybrid sensor histidine kinase/response regulator [Wenzhouxiangella sp. EGI_FJ10409]|uniref:hybrid sensor histidine kinase/response regulator n=1 Tax=Wenzhouxiangella sp. EGI_FJ10409 TaxID=3243767 RepID=UPI0035DB33BA
MFSPPLIAALSLAYVGLLFAIAWWGDRVVAVPLGGRTRAVIYSLSLAVYCTSWTFFGAVGSAVENGWLFATIYLGPVLVLIFGHDLMQRILRQSRQQRLTSIADFIAHRYGRSRPLAVAVTLAAVVGAIPYIALQLKAVTMGLVAISDGRGGLSEQALALLLALGLGVFAVLFGARRLEASEHHRGMVLAVAFESLVKLVAFAAVGLWALFAVLDGPAGMVERIGAQAEYRELFLPSALPEGFWVQTLLAAAAILCLPRQFQVSFVENEEESDLRTARWLFPLYLIAFTLLVIPIALAGMERLGAGNFNADTFVLTLPMSEGQGWLTMLSFLGGFSAATGMVIVATVALATMVSNDLLVPMLLRLKKSRRGEDFSQVVLNARRITIIALAVMAWLYYLVLQATDRLAAIGLMSFAAVIQFAPALVIGVYWRGASREGAMTGLLFGLGVWLSMIFMPSMLTDWPAWLEPGLYRATLLGLLGNVTALVLVSLWVRRRRPVLPRLLGSRTARPVTIGELRELAAGFIGRERVDTAFASALGSDDRTIDEEEPADHDLIGFTERLLSGCIGSASARTVLAAGLRRSGMQPDDALALLEQTSSAIQFNRDLLDATLDHISQGVSVVDADLRLVSWNRAYIDLFDYPPGMVYIGRPVEELIRFNLERWHGGAPSKIEAGVNRRMHHMKRRTPYVFERQHSKDRVIEIRGNPMPQGGYVTTYTDITSFKRTEHELKQAYGTMEQQVAERTRELNQAMEALAAAKREAEAANESKSRFLAAASHDLLQPLNAARLFSSTLRQSADHLPAEEANLSRRVDHSLSVAEDLLSALLDISRLDQGALQPRWSEFPVQVLLDKLERQFAALANRRGLKLRLRRSGIWVRSDQKLLQRILANLVGNALRYTREGGVLVGCRRHDDQVAVEVWDSGPGIAEADRERVFDEFERLAGEDEPHFADQGLGLGLAICQRISLMLDTPLNLRSKIGRGSVFSVTVPVAPAGRWDEGQRAPQAAEMPREFAGRRVLCLDDDPDVLDGMRAILQRWGCEVFTATDRAAAAAQIHRNPDLMIVDYHLEGQDNGLDAALAIRAESGRAIPVLVVTADRGEELLERVGALGFRRLLKPIKPAALRAVMRRLLDDA